MLGGKQVFKNKSIIAEREAQDYVLLLFYMHLGTEADAKHVLLLRLGTDGRLWQDT